MKAMKRSAAVRIGSSGYRVASHDRTTQSDDEGEDLLASEATRPETTRVVYILNSNRPSQQEDALPGFVEDKRQFIPGDIRADFLPRVCTWEGRIRHRHAEERAQWLPSIFH